MSNSRRVIFILIIIAVIVACLTILQERERTELTLTLSRQDIMAGLNGEVQEAVAHGQQAYLLFPRDFKGEGGDRFYLVLVGDQKESRSYLIMTPSSGSGITYRLKERWDGLQLPSSKFESYQFEDGKWNLIQEEAMDG